MKPYIIDLPRRAKTKQLNQQVILPFTPNKKSQYGAMGESAKEHVYEYSCAMLQLSDDISSTIIEWMHDNIDENKLYIDKDSGIDGYEYNPHITVKYSIHEVDPKSIEELIEGFGPIKVELGKISKFNTNPHYDVIKIDVESNKLMKLNQYLTDNLKCTDSFKTYIPHATIAYVKKDSHNKLISNNTFDKLKDEIGELYFTARTGDEYYLSL